MGYSQCHISLSNKIWWLWSLLKELLNMESTFERRMRTVMSPFNALTRKLDETFTIQKVCIILLLVLLFCLGKTVRMSGNACGILTCLSWAWNLHCTLRGTCTLPQLKSHPSCETSHPGKIGFQTSTNPFVYVLIKVITTSHTYTISVMEPEPIALSMF